MKYISIYIENFFFLSESQEKFSLWGKLELYTCEVRDAHCYHRVAKYSKDMYR
jgi:hypothetical protein